MNDISLMKVVEDSRFGKIRVFEKGGEPWFAAKDVADVLEYSWNGTKRIEHVPEEWRGVTSVVTPFGKQDIAVLSEQGLYFFLARSDKSSALPFQKWIAGEVLPSIRKTGSYSMPLKKEDILDPDFIITLATALKEERAEKKRLQLENAVQERRLAVAEPKAETLDKITAAANDLSVRELASVLAVPHLGQNNLFERLRKDSYIDGYNRPYRQYIESGFMYEKEYYVPQLEATKRQLRITQKGVVYFTRKYGLTEVSRTGRGKAELVNAEI